MSNSFVRDKLTQLLMLVTAIVVAFVIEHVVENQKNLVWEAFTGLFALGPEQWKAIGITFGTSLVAFLIATCGGWTLGHLVAASVVNPSEDSVIYRGIAKFDVIYGGVYIVPLVLTLGFTHAAGGMLADRYNLPNAFVAVLIVTVASLALGGYMVYRSIFQATKQASADARYLVSNMHMPECKGPAFWRAFRGRLLSARRYRDCQIHSCCDAVVMAFHLAVVSVMILESITPQFYELLWPQTGPIYTALGGVGRQIVIAQQANAVQLIAGYVWAVVIFDFIVVSLIELALYRRWRRHYAEGL